MQRRIILHVGSPKCGSTYLQHVLLQNQALLRKNGVNYPASEGNHPGNGMILKDMTQAQFDGLFPDPNVHTTLLSHESLYSVPLWTKPLSEMIKGTDITVQIVAFLRPLSAFIYGDYSQFMKQFFDAYLETRSPYDGKTFEEFATHRIENLKPANFLQSWANLYPGLPLSIDSHLNIRPSVESLIGTIRGMDWDVPAEATNPSLRVSDCDSIANAMRDPNISADALRNMFKVAFSKIGTADPGRTPERTHWLEKQFDQQNAVLLEKFGFDNRLS
jgi:hypothetical protein